MTSYSTTSRCLLSPIVQQQLSSLIINRDHTPTVFHGTWNFQPNGGICPFPGISMFSRNSVLVADKGTNTAYFRRAQAVVEKYLLQVDMTVPSNK